MRRIGYVQRACFALFALDNDATEESALDIAEHLRAHVARAVAHRNLRRALIAADEQNVVRLFARRFQFEREIFLRGDRACKRAAAASVGILLFKEIVILDPRFIVRAHVLDEGFDALLVDGRLCTAVAERSPAERAQRIEIRAAARRTDG